jgi:hypothetical protein
LANGAFLGCRATADAGRDGSTNKFKRFLIETKNLTSFFSDSIELVNIQVKVSLIEQKKSTFYLNCFLDLSSSARE